MLLLLQCYLPLINNVLLNQSSCPIDHSTIIMSWLYQCSSHLNCHTTKFQSKTPITNFISLWAPNHVKWFSIFCGYLLFNLSPENHIWPLMSFRPEIHFILLPITLICSICKVMFLFRLHILSMPILGREDTINDKIWNGMQQNDKKKNDQWWCNMLQYHVSFMNFINTWI